MDICFSFEQTKRQLNYHNLSDVLNHSKNLGYHENGTSLNIQSPSVDCFPIIATPASQNEVFDHILSLQTPDQAPVNLKSSCMSEKVKYSWKIHTLVHTNVLSNANNFVINTNEKHKNFLVQLATTHTRPEPQLPPIQLWVIIMIWMQTYTHKLQSWISL